MAKQINLSLNEILERKKCEKEKLAKALTLDVKSPLVALVLDHELSKKDEQTLLELLKAAKSTKIQIAILADTNLGALEKAVSANIKLLDYDQDMRKRLLEAADMAITFEFNDIQEMLLHGTVPISKNRPEVLDYNPNRESGNSFTYSAQDPWCIFAATVRALETFRFPYDWKNIVRTGLQSVNL